MNNKCCELEKEINMKTIDWFVFWLLVIKALVVIAYLNQ